MNLLSTFNLLLLTCCYPELDWNNDHDTRMMDPLSWFVDAADGDLRILTKLSTGEIPNPELAPWAFGKYMV
jgi:hypothetical protein